MEIVPDFSSKITDTEGQEYLLDGRYDFIRNFPSLGYGIINIVTDEGVNRLFLKDEQIQAVRESSRLPYVELDWIMESENETIRQIEATNLDDSWLQ